MRSRYLRVAVLYHVIVYNSVIHVLQNRLHRNTGKRNGALRRGLSLADPCHWKYRHPFNEDHWAALQWGPACRSRGREKEVLGKADTAFLLSLLKAISVGSCENRINIMLHIDSM